MPTTIKKPGSGRRNLEDERMRALSLYVSSEEPPTQAELMTLLGVSNRVIVKWRKEDKWEEKRKELYVTPFSLAARIKKALSDQIDLYEEARKESGKANPKYVREIDQLSRILERVDQRADMRGHILLALQYLLEYLQLQKEKDGLKLANRIFPDFLNWIEAKLQ